MTRFVILELFVANLLLFEHQQDVVNHCLEFTLHTSAAEHLPRETCLSLN